MTRVIWTRQAVEDVEVIKAYVVRDSERYATRRLHPALCDFDPSTRGRDLESNPGTQPSQHVYQRIGTEELDPTTQQVADARLSDPMWLPGAPAAKGQEAIRVAYAAVLSGRFTVIAKRDEGKWVYVVDHASSPPSAPTQH